MTLTVGIITNSYPPNLNGVSLAVSNLKAGLEAKGVKVVIATPKIPDVIYPNNIFPLPSKAAPIYTSNDLRIPTRFDKKVLNFLRQNNVDILHSQDTFMGGMDAIFLAQKLHIPIVHTYHTFVEKYDYFKIPGYKQFIRSYSQLVCDSCDAVVTLSPKIKTYLNELNIQTKLINLPNIYLKPNSPPQDTQKVQNFIRIHKLENTFNIITFGRVATEKNILNGLIILEPLLKQYTNFRYIIAGDGPQIEELRIQIDNLNLQNQVLIYGKYIPGELNTLLQQCNCFFNTSYSEVLPTTPLEALSEGLPCFCVDDNAFEYIIVNGVNGYLLPENQLPIAISKLFHDLELQLKLKKQSLNSFVDYQKQDIAQYYIDFYNDIINDYKPKPWLTKFISNKISQINSSIFNDFATRQ